ncbi:MAG: hypothetical protein WCK55_13920 [Verrucomicrobiota bacterium]
MDETDHAKEQTWRKDIWAFISSAKDHWKEIAQGALASAVIGWISSVVLSPAAASVVGACIFGVVACFLAFRDQRRKVEAAGIEPKPLKIDVADIEGRQKHEKLKAELDAALEMVAKTKENLSKADEKIAKLSTADLESRDKIGVAESELALAKDRLQQLEAANKHRWGLSADSLKLLTSKMSAHAAGVDRGDIITCVMGDQESSGFAWKLAEAFRNAGWNLPGSGTNQAMYSMPVYGIVVQARTQNENPPGLSDFITIIRSEGIEFRGELDDSLPPNQFRIIVGSDPARRL